MDLSQSVGVCPVCRSSRYHKTDAGFLVCEFGHQSQAFWEEHEDEETYFGITRRIQSSQPRLSQNQEAPVSTAPELVRSGNVDLFVKLEFFQAMLKRQIEDVRKIVALPDSFESTVKHIWLSYVSSVNINYNEEYEDVELTSQLSSQRSSISELSLSFDSDLDMDSDGEPIMSCSRPSSTGSSKLPKAGEFQFLLGLPIISLALLYHRVPLYLCDIYHLVVTGRISYFNMLDVVPKELSQNFKTCLKAILKNPGNFYKANLASLEVQFARFMFSKIGADLPMYDIRLLMWRIGEELFLPTLFREDLVHLAVRLEIIPVVGQVHERMLSNPLINMFALVLFYLKLNYGLLDSLLQRNDFIRMYTESDLPTLYQLLQVWKERLRHYENPQLFDRRNIAANIELYRDVVISAKIPEIAKVDEDYQQIRRALNTSIILDRFREEAAAPTPAWIPTPPDSTFSLNDNFAKRYVCSQHHRKKEEDRLEHWSESFRVLIHIGAHFCCCAPEQITRALEYGFETVPSYQWVLSRFS